MTAPGPLDPYAVVITGQQIYDRLVDVSTKVDRLVDGHTQADRIVTDHETRIRALERRVWSAAGGAGVIGAAGAALVQYLTSH